MREIKFRAWVKAGKNTNYVMMQNTDLSLVFKLNNKGGFEKYHAEEYVLMQYTGLKDKNGVEIYEGDIVDYNFRRPYENERFTGRVYYDEYMWLVDGDTKHNEAHSINRLNEVEVIGNIYENKELLK